MKVYRISKTKYAEDHNGTGAALFGGRWNSINNPMVYTSGSVALATLEVIANLSDIIPSSFYSLITYEVPEDQILQLASRDLPEEWYTARKFPDCQIIGDYFLKSDMNACLEVPSAVVLIEKNYLLNPRSVHFSAISVVSIKPYRLDKRLYTKKQ